MERPQLYAAPEPLGAYSVAVISKRPLLMLSGQIALIPGEDAVLDNETPAIETHRIMQNIGLVLKSAGCSYSDICRSMIFISDAQYFTEVDSAYREYFEAGKYPVRSCIEAKPPVAGAHVEIEIFAEVPQQMSSEYCI